MLLIGGHGRTRLPQKRGCRPVSVARVPNTVRKLCRINFDMIRTYRVWRLRGQIVCAGGATVSPRCTFCGADKLAHGGSITCFCGILCVFFGCFCGITRSEFCVFLVEWEYEKRRIRGAHCTTTHLIRSRCYMRQARSLLRMTFERCSRPRHSGIVFVQIPYIFYVSTSRCCVPLFIDH